MSGGVGGEDDMDDMHDDNESHHEINSSAALIDAHKLILEIYAVAPGVLLSVIPQLEEELKVENVHVRSLSTQVMGHMFSSVDGVQLAATYPSVWRNWVDR